MKILKASFAILVLVIGTTLFSACHTTTAHISASPEQTVFNNANNYLIEVNENNRIIIALPAKLQTSPKMDQFIKQKILCFLQGKTGILFDLSYTDISPIESNMEINDDYTEYMIELDAQIAFSNEEVISIVLSGIMNHRAAAYPQHLFFSINYSYRTNSDVSLSSVYDIDDDLYEAFLQAVQAKIITKCDAAWWSTNGENFVENCCSVDAFRAGLLDGGAFNYYFTDFGIGICFPVPHALGDYIVVELENTEDR